MGIFDLLDTGYDGMSSDTVAERLHTNPDATERLMNACVGLGLLRKHTSSNYVGKSEYNCFIYKMYISQYCTN